MAIAAVLLGFGVFNLIGNAICGVTADRALRGGFSTTGLLLGVATLGLVMLDTNFVSALMFGMLWVFAWGAAPVMIQTWMGRSAPDELEGVGGFFLAALQFAIALGAIAGGTAVDLYGVNTPLYMTTLVRSSRCRDHWCAAIFEGERPRCRACHRRVTRPRCRQTGDHHEP